MFSFAPTVLAVLAELQLLNTLDIAVAGIFVLDLKGKGIKSVRQNLGKLRHRQGIFIRLPHNAIVDIPDIAVTGEPSDGLEVICKGVTNANLVTLVAWVRVGLHLLQLHRNERQSRSEGRLLLGTFRIIQVLELILCGCGGIADGDIDGGIGEIKIEFKEEI